MLLRPSLEDKEVPRRDRLREGVIEKWHDWFDSLKRELAVCTISAICFVQPIRNRTCQVVLALQLTHGRLGISLHILPSPATGFPIRGLAAPFY